jgi:hypothetical protein
MYQYVIRAHVYDFHGAISLAFYLHRFVCPILMTCQNKTEMMSEWVSDYCFTPNEQFIRYIMTRTSYIRWDDDDIHFLLDHHAYLDFYSVCSQKQQ